MDNDVILKETEFEKKFCGKEWGVIWLITIIISIHITYTRYYKQLGYTFCMNKIPFYTISKTILHELLTKKLIFSTIVIEITAEINY